MTKRRRWAIAGLAVLALLCGGAIAGYYSLRGAGTFHVIDMAGNEVTLPDPPNIDLMAERINRLYAERGVPQLPAFLHKQPNPKNFTMTANGLREMWMSRLFHGYTGELTPFHFGNGILYLNNAGEVAVEPKQPVVYATDFSEDLAAVATKEKPNGGNSWGFDGWGYIDRSGEFVIPPIYEQAGAFSEGLAPVRKDDKIGYIDKAGNVVIPFQFMAGWPFSEGLAKVSDSKVEGFIDKTGHFVLPPTNYSADSFSEGLAPVSKEGLWGYIDKTGNYVIPPKFRQAKPFHEGRALASLEEFGALGYIDKTGNFVIPPHYLMAGPFHNGHAAVTLDSPLIRILDNVSYWLTARR